jgi:hypothetical protein
LPDSLELEGELEVGVDGIEVGLCGITAPSFSSDGSAYFPFTGVVIKEDMGWKKAG